MTPARIASVVAIVALVAGLGYWSYVSERGAAGGDAKAPVPGKPDDKSAKAGQPPGKGGPGGRPAPVEVAKAATRALQEDLAAVGTIRANETVVLRPEIAGRISRIGFTEGQAVQKGAVLVELDASVARAEFAQARAQLDLAKANYERTVELAGKNFVSPSARDQAASTLQVQEATLELARARLARYTIVAPFDGVVGLRNVSVGDFVKDGAELVTVDDAYTVKVDFRLPERYAPAVRSGQAIEFTVEALPGRTFKATVYALDAQVDANGRSILVRARADNRGQQLRGGMFARLRVVLAERPEAVVVPEEAIVPSATGQVVFRVVDGRATRTPVTLGLRREGVVEVLKGVAAGDTVVTAGQIRIPGEGGPVNIAGAGGPPAQKGGESKGSDAKGGDAKGGEARAGDARAAEPKPGEGKAGDAKAGKAGA